MTKIYEEFIRTEIDNLESENLTLKGELTIVISEKNLIKTSQVLSESDKKLIKKMINKFPVKEIIRSIKNENISKKTIYDYCIKLKR